MNRHKKWITKVSRVLLLHERLTVLEDVVVLPNGREINYLKFKKTHDSVTIIAQREDGKILILSEYSYPPDKWLYEFPGGSVNSGETVEHAAQRELSEESSFVSGGMQLLGKYFLDNRRSDARMHVFFAANLTKKHLKKDDEELFEYHWFTIDEIDKLILEGQIVNAHILAPWTLLRVNMKSQS